MKPDIATMSDSELRAEMCDYLGDKPRQRWKWVRYEGERIDWPEFRADGTARAEGVSERTVLEALVNANRKLRDKRSRAARAAAETRARRRDKELYRIAHTINVGGRTGPQMHCLLCGRGLTDEESIARGVGSECWQHVLDVMEGMA